MTIRLYSSFFCFHILIPRKCKLLKFNSITTYTLSTPTRYKMFTYTNFNTITNFSKIIHYQKLLIKVKKFIADCDTISTADT